MAQNAPEVVDLIDESVVVRDLQGRIHQWNAASQRLYGWSCEEAVGFAIEALLHADHPPPPQGVSRRLLETGAWEGELTRSTKSGTTVRVEARWRLRRDGAGAPRDIVEIGRDAARHNPVEGQLGVAESRYRNMFHAVAVSFWELDFRPLNAVIDALRAAGVTDLVVHARENPGFTEQLLADVVVTDVNEASLQLFGATRREDLFGDTARFWPAASRTVFLRSLNAALHYVPRFQAETRMATLDGREIDVIFTTCAPPGDGETRTVLIGILDVTERVAARSALQRMQAELAHAARVSVLGELTASIAHEVNQPLAAIATNGEVGLRWLDRPDLEVAEVRAIVTDVVADARRAASIIARIRDMAVRREPEPKPLSLNEVIEEAMLFLHHDLRARRVEVALDLAPDLPMVVADRTQLQQVVVNLTVNAMQAMTDASSPRREVLASSRLLAEGVVQIAIADSGPGIAAAARDRLFDSFFTTKPDGLGIGLPICRSIIEAHGGTIGAANRAGSPGAEVVFTLPETRPSP